MKIHTKFHRSTLLIVLFSLTTLISFAQKEDFQWPEGKTMAVSLTWDDGRKSQVTTGTPLLDAYGIKATFYVVPYRVEEDLEGWRSAVKNGHEIANHSLTHPCTGNFLWSREAALEEYSISQIGTDLAQANEKIKEQLGVTPTEFAYPCGQTFVGRGSDTKSYVPIVANQFVSGRTWMDEVPNDPAFCDLSQLTGIEMDGKNIKYIKDLIETAKKDGSWLILAGHDIGSKNRQTTEVKMLKKLLPYLVDPSNKIWVAPVGEISAYIKKQRNL
ncbi:MAG: polysaccharide deacetylase family protein [Flavobacteriaceae bacterium]